MNESVCFCCTYITTTTYLGTGLGEAEDIVNEKKHILTLLVSEVLRNGETSKGDPSTSSRRLVHLTED